MNTFTAVRKYGTSKARRNLTYVITKDSIFVQAKCVLNSEAHSECPEEMKFHDNSEESINCRAVVQAE